MATKTKGISVIPTLFVVAVVAAGGFLWNSYSNGRDDDFETVEAVVEWSPTSRAIPIEIAHTGDWEGEGRSKSPWFREFTVKRGLTVTVTAKQLEPGRLRCHLYGKSSKTSDSKQIDTVGSVTCTYRAT